MSFKARRTIVAALVISLLIQIMLAANGYASRRTKIAFASARDGNLEIWLFRVKCGKGVSYKNAAMTRIRKCSKFRNPKARRLMSLILLLMPSTMPLVVR